VAFANKKDAMTFRRMSAQMLHHQSGTNIPHLRIPSPTGPKQLVSMAKNNYPEVFEEDVEKFTKMCAVNGLTVVIYQPSSRRYQIVQTKHDIDKHILRMNLEMIYSEMSRPYKN
jgi:hypothetical protein